MIMNPKWICAVVSSFFKQFVKIEILFCFSVADPHHHHLDADSDPDPKFHFDADPDHNFQIKDQNHEKVLR